MVQRKTEKEKDSKLTSSGGIHKERKRERGFSQPPCKKADIQKHAVQNFVHAQKY